KVASISSAPEPHSVTLLLLEIPVNAFRLLLLMVAPWMEPPSKLKRAVQLVGCSSARSGAATSLFASPVSIAPLSWRGGSDIPRLAHPPVATSTRQAASVAALPPDRGNRAKIVRFSIEEGSPGYLSIVVAVQIPTAVMLVLVNAIHRPVRCVDIP